MPLTKNVSRVPDYYHGTELIIVGDTYEPAEDSYAILEVVHNLSLPASKDKPRMCADIGCGSGILTLELCFLCKEVIAIDLSPDAVASTSINMKNSVGKHKCLWHVVQGDGVASLRREELFEVVLFNPPYLPVRDAGWAGIAWSGGYEGIEVFLRISRDVYNVLDYGGKYVFLLSSLGNVSRAITELRNMGYDVVMRSVQKFFFEELYVYEASKVA